MNYARIPDKYTVLTEIFLLMGAFQSILYPILAFVAACLQVRYKNDYNKQCQELVVDEAQSESNQLLLFQLRLMQSLFYAYSVSYFLLLVRNPLNRVYKTFGAAFAILNVVIVLAGVFGFATMSSVKCNEDMIFGSFNMVLNGAGAVLSAGLLIVTLVLYTGFKSSGQIPFFEPDPSIPRTNENKSATVVPSEVDESKKILVPGLPQSEADNIE
uniref:Uncharacterized protein n=1 Tax=Strombidium rassoulzadegani TaxID=1082188 RepID=A0A7S3CSB8_9SPIT|mmetsp:Transcript_6607/g.11136  ORF Transcript_6607/g.11136 Transcript_6607/m.11136 type:complete len:214 (+) Transcript_6607:7-648(+)